MDEIADKERVLATLRSELQKNRTKSNVLGITQLGLVEMTRKKTRQCISHTLQSPCPYCGGDGKVLSHETVVLKARKQLMRMISTDASCDYLLRVHPHIAEIIADHSLPQAPILPITNGRTIYVQGDGHMRVDEFEVTRLSSQEDVRHAQTVARAYPGT